MMDEESLAELHELRAAKWKVKHTDTMNEAVQMRLAIEGQDAELRSLRERMKSLEEGLIPFAAIAPLIPEGVGDDYAAHISGLTRDWFVEMGDFRRARVLLDNTPSPKEQSRG